MYRQHFGLKYVPFSKNSPFLWMNDSLTFFKERFISLLHSPGIGVLTGEPGVGKTALLRSITQELNPHQYQVFYLSETQFTSFDIYRQLALSLGLIPHHRYAQLWRDIKNHIIERVERKNNQLIWIIDEAHNLPFDFFSSFPSFLNFAFDSKDMMTVWFVGHSQLNTIIDRHVNAALSSRIQVRYPLNPIIEREQFTQLIHHAFKEAGCQTMLLSDSGIEILRVASQGKPRHANRILACTMELAAKKGLQHLPDDFIQQAIKELKG
jgi:type II secretory pathway predicted ATPase ExeA